MNTLKSIITNTDSYKLSQWLQYPDGTTNVFSYIESRGCSLDWKDPVIMMMGIQRFVKTVMSKPFTQEDIDFAERFANLHGEPFHKEGWQYILEEHGGYIPVVIRSVREGTVMPLKNIMVSVEATDKKCAWVVSYIETALLRAVWYPSSVATNSFRAKRILNKYLTETGGIDGLPFKLHDFGARGVSSEESAEIGGAAHLVNFMGTDTISGILSVMEVYGDDVCAFSIPASEHSTMTAWTKKFESDCYANMIHKFGGDGKTFAIVCDSYDIYHAVSHILGQELKFKVMETGGTLVVRPDSGDPLVVPIEIIESLMEKFGHRWNKEGYRILPDYIRVIQGDGITVDSMEQILKRMKERGLSAGNIAFGMGAGLLQKVDRDTYKFAMKASAAEIDGEWINIFKDPVTDPGKASKKGRMTLVQDVVNREFRTIKIGEPLYKNEVDVMVTFYDNGPIEEAYETFAQVRERAASYL